MRKLFYVLTAVAVAATLACGSNTAGNHSNAAKPANSGNTTSSTPAATPSSSPALESKAGSGSQATPTEAYKSAYEYRKKADLAGLKKVMSNDVLEFLTEMGKMENKSLDDMLTEMTKDPQADTADVRNEKITGDTATLEYLKKDGGWSTMDFIREGSEWKMTIPKGPDGEKKK